MLTGENGIIAKAREAKEKTEIAAWEERIDLAIIEAEGEKRNPTLEDVIDKLYDNDIIDDKENDVNRETGAITTNEPEYVIEGKLDDYLDNQGSTEPEEPPVYEEGDIIFSYNPQEMTNKDVEVTITKNVEENYTIEYSKYNTNNWEEYVSPVIMEKNGAIYARLKNNAGVSNYATGNVTNIDKLPPNEPTVQIISVTKNSITVKGEATDQTATEEYANSGIQGYRFSKDNGESWEPSAVQANGSYTFFSLTEDTEYQIKVKVIDNAGNETITEDSTSQKTESGEITAGDIENNSSIFGSEVVGYECTNSAAVNKWLIFYADSNNIYLISDDYIPYEYIPTNSKGHKPSKGGSYERDIYFTNDILNDYIGSSDIKDDRIKALNNDYFNIKGYSSTNSNMKAIAYLLDTETCEVFAGSKAEYAIGGPSIELFLKSYNKKYGTNYVTEAKDEGEYDFGADSSSMSTNFIFSNTIDPLYSKSSLNSATAYLLTSTGGGTDSMIQSGINSNSCGLLSIKPCFMSGYGIRPIVCLKSDTKLEKNSNGGYIIK